MALKSTIYKVELQLSDLDRHVYGEHTLTLALHPSETEERLMARLLLYALQVPANDMQGRLVFAKGLSDPDEPDLWHRNHADEIEHWLEVGHPDDRRLVKACGRASRVTVLAYQASTPIWFAGIANKITRLRNLEVWSLSPSESQALAALARRALRCQVTIQDGTVWFSTEDANLELTPQRLYGGQ